MAEFLAISSFGDCRRMSQPGVVKGFEQPFIIKNQNAQLKKTKRRPLQVKPIMDKRMSMQSQRYVYVCIYIYTCICACVL